jgi:hypothetical protein
LAGVQDERRQGWITSNYQLPTPKVATLGSWVLVVGS